MSLTLICSEVLSYPPYPNLFGAASLSPLTECVQRHCPDPHYPNCNLLLLTLALGYGLIFAANDNPLKVSCEVMINLTCCQSLWS